MHLAGTMVGLKNTTMWVDVTEIKIININLYILAYAADTVCVAFILVIES